MAVSDLDVLLFQYNFKTDATTMFLITKGQLPVFLLPYNFITFKHYYMKHCVLLGLLLCLWYELHNFRNVLHYHDVILLLRMKPNRQMDKYPTISSEMQPVTLQSYVAVTTDMP